MKNGNPTSLRIPDPGIAALFEQDARWQAWLDVEAALAKAEAELGIIPEAAAQEIVAKCDLSLFDKIASFSSIFQLIDKSLSLQSIVSSFSGE